MAILQGRQQMAVQWSLCSLELDNDGAAIGEFFQSRGYNIKRVNLRDKKAEIDCAPRKTIEDIVASALPRGGKVLALSSHGNYHHLTYGLCRRADRLSRRYGYIHIDRHNDTTGEINESDSVNIHCGRFVRALCNDANIDENQLRPDVLIIGAKGFLFTGILCGFFSDMLGSLERHLRRLPEDVYVSIDLDVLAPSEVRTAFNRGSMKAEKLYSILHRIKNAKNIISADIIGYTKSNSPRSAYDCKTEFWWEGMRDEPEPAFEQSMHVYKGIADIITGKLI